MEARKPEGRSGRSRRSEQKWGLEASSKGRTRIVYACSHAHMHRHLRRECAEEQTTRVFLFGSFQCPTRSHQPENIRLIPIVDRLRMAHCNHFSAWRLRRLVPVAPALRLALLPCSFLPPAPIIAFRICGRRFPFSVPHLISTSLVDLSPQSLHSDLFVYSNFVVFFSTSRFTTVALLRLPSAVVIFVQSSLGCYWYCDRCSHR